MPDLWDTNPEHVFGTPDEQPDPAPDDREDHPKEKGPRADRGRLRPSAYLLIALVIAVVAILVVLVGLDDEASWDSQVGRHLGRPTCGMRGCRWSGSGSRAGPNVEGA